MPKKLTIEHLFYTISIATNKRTFFKRLWILGHPSSGCDEIRNEFIKAMGYSCQWILSAFGTNDHQHEEMSCIMTSKNRSSMVKDTKAKGYKIVFLVWYILLRALCNHTESRIATDQLDCLATCLNGNGLLLKTVSEYVGQTAGNVYLWLSFLFGVHPVLLASTGRHLLQYWIIEWGAGCIGRQASCYIINLAFLYTPGRVWRIGNSSAFQKMQTICITQFCEQLSWFVGRQVICIKENSIPI